MTHLLGMHGLCGGSGRAYPWHDALLVQRMVYTDRIDMHLISIRVLHGLVSLMSRTSIG